MRWKRHAITIPVLVVLITMGADAGTWKKAAKSHARYAKSLAAEKIKITPDFRDWIDLTVDEDCAVVPEQVEGLRKNEQRWHALYRDAFCKPWSAAWDAVFDACEKEGAPAWCEEADALAGHVPLDAYFKVLASTVARTKAPLARYNLMAVIAHSTTPDVIAEFPADRVDSWIAPAVKKFLENAAPEDAIEIARSLEENPAGFGTRVAREYASFAERNAALTDAQREAIGAVLAAASTPDDDEDEEHEDH